MNAAIRRVSTVAIVLLLALMVAATNIQVREAPALNADGRNVRSIYREFGVSRGPIIVDGKAVVSSVPSDDAFGYQRTYTDGRLFSHVTGYFSIVFGRDGIERAENEVLNGTADSFFLRRMQDLITGHQQRGGSVELTLSRTLQEVATKALGSQRGAVVALDVETGAILAMVSTPTYDPAVLAKHSSSKVNEAYQELLADDTHPLRNRATSTIYPPGSTFKILTAAAALESGQFTADTVIPAPDTFKLPQSSSVLQNFGGSRCSPSGEQSLADALRISCNTAFAQLGLDVGQDQLRRTAEAFGFNERSSVPIPVSASNFPSELSAPELALSSIGQMDIAATPLQMASVAQAVANGGDRLEPYLVERVRDANLDIVSSTDPTSAGRAVSASTARALTEMMVGVVDSGSGTAARIPGVKVAGKTGTAQTTKEAAPHAWFIGFAPVDAPKIAVAVVVENGGSMGSEATGGAVAAPIARKVLEAGLR
ncbi:penicillin-binding protein 2 [Sanguibacter sp. HDW7]|uniref:peptidoglycan D,D-transpeptidase FtsI family protein n=1 Tax=Sanguibacter sp. HDW7 TaxID=2714931 RepID=UPI0014076B82|nr:penicillin-binding transpeptidase domain-containing protein [Sanguibacter sp. HDW7]QIK84763.1 penicillin-binding protein 2 [Sanguibacter sp. HDW7]